MLDPLLLVASVHLHLHARPRCMHSGVHLHILVHYLLMLVVGINLCYWHDRGPLRLNLLVATALRGVHGIMLRHRVRSRLRYLEEWLTKGRAWWVWVQVLIRIAWMSLVVWLRVRGLGRGLVALSWLIVRIHIIITNTIG